MPVISNVRPHAMLSRAHVNAQRALRHSNPNARASTHPPFGEAVSVLRLPASARAVRPLAVSARSWWLVAGAGSSVEPEGSIEEVACRFKRGFPRHFKSPVFSGARAAFGQVTACSKQRQALRRAATSNARGRAATSFARGGTFGLLASGATQRKMCAGRVPFGARSNPSINRTSPGKPGAACYLKR